MRGWGWSGTRMEVDACLGMIKVWWDNKARRRSWEEQIRRFYWILLLLYKWRLFQYRDIFTPISAYLAWQQTIEMAIQPLPTYMRQHQMAFVFVSSVGIDQARSTTYWAGHHRALCFSLINLTNCAFAKAPESDGGCRGQISVAVVELGFSVDSLAVHPILILKREQSVNAGVSGVMLMKRLPEWSMYLPLRSVEFSRSPATPRAPYNWLLSRMNDLYRKALTITLRNSG